MKKKTAKINKSTILSLLLTSTIYLGAVLIYFYANGWRIDPKEEDLIVKTGSVSVESVPVSTSITVGDKEFGKAPKSFSLNIGEHHITVSNKGYSSWEKDIVVKEEKLIPLEPWLLPIEKTETEIFTQEGMNIVEYWVDEGENKLLFLTKDIEEEIDDTLENTELETNTYTLWAYDINRVFWDLSDNPYELFSFETQELQSFNISLSHTGTEALATISAEETNYYILNTTRATEYEELETLNISELKDYEMTWSLDDKHLIFESDEELLTYDISENTKHLIFKKEENKNYTWTTDTDGYFYQILPVETEENIYKYSLNRKDLDGANSTTLLSELYFQKDSTYIEQYREERKDLIECACSTFTNSPESTQTVGEITSLEINQDAKGMFVKTSEASYWYSFTNKKWLLVNPYPSDILEFSTNQEMFTYTNDQGVHIFTFEKDKADHTSVIGSRKLQILDKAQNITWLANDHLQFTKESILYVIDEDGDNQIEILNLETVETSAITKTLDKVITLERIQNTENDEIIENGFTFSSYSLE